jgi:hypothetical protein
MSPPPPIESRTDASLPSDFERDRLLSEKKRLLAADERLAGPQKRRDDRSGRARRKGDIAPAPRGKVGDEECSPAERAGKPGEESTTTVVGVHRHVVVHPGYGVGLAVNGFAGRSA